MTIKHLLMYEDGRFAKHPRFRFFALNTEMRRRGFLQQSTPLRCKSPWYQTVLVQTAQPSHLHGRHLWTTHHIFTHSAGDLQWPELARLICPEDPGNASARIKAVNENPAIADWFFCHRVQKFLDVFYIGVLKATDYWMRFEWQHRGSPHVHGVAWLPNAPDVEQLLTSAEVPD